MEIIDIQRAINKCHESDLKRYFKLKDLVSITGYSHRGIKKRAKEIIPNYCNIPNLFQKVGRDYKIHYSIVDNFMPSRPRKETLYNREWTTFLVINPHSDYKDFKIFVKFIDELKMSFTDSYHYFAIESSFENKSKNVHLHLASTLTQNELKEEVYRLSDIYFGKSKILYSEVINRYMTINYLRKANHLKEQRYITPNS